jgi:hypothetical protein
VPADTWHTTPCGRPSGNPAPTPASKP